MAGVDGVELIANVSQTWFESFDRVWWLFGLICVSNWCVVLVSN